MKIDYFKIKMLENSMKSQRQMALKIGMSPPGYKKMMENRSCKMKTLVSIAKEFNKPLSYFFETDNNETQEPTPKYNQVCSKCKEKDERITEFKERINELKYTIEEQKEKIRELKEKIEELKGNNKKGNQLANSA